MISDCLLSVELLRRMNFECIAFKCTVLYRQYLWLQKPMHAVVVLGLWSS